MKLSSIEKVIKAAYWIIPPVVIVVILIAFLCIRFTSTIPFFLFKNLTPYPESIFRRNDSLGTPFFMYLLENAAKNGNMVAQYDLACSIACTFPFDVEKNMFWCRKSAEQGYARAQRELGIVLLENAKTPTDSDEAVYWLKKARDAGDLEADSILKNANITTETNQDSSAHNGRIQKSK